MSAFKRVDTTANRLKVALKETGKKQIDLVRETGIDKGSISHYVSGKYVPKQDAIYKLAKSLDVSEMWLWGYDCEKERPLEQKKNDIMSDVIVRMRTDSEFFSLIETLYGLDDEKVLSVKQMILTFLK